MLDGLQYAITLQNPFQQFLDRSWIVLWPQMYHFGSFFTPFTQIYSHSRFLFLVWIQYSDSWPLQHMQTPKGIVSAR